MKASFEYPSEHGVPTRLNYATLDKERARVALDTMHEALGRQFPPVCPIDLDRSTQQPESRPVPPTEGIGKGADLPEGITRWRDTQHAPEAPAAAAFKATPEEDGQFGDADVFKSFKKMRKRLGKKVLSGKMTVDEARARLGRQFAQKGSDEEAAVQKSAAVERVLPEIGADGYTIHNRPPAPAPVAASFDPEVVKTAVAEATTELKDLLVKQQEAFTTKLAEQQRVIDAIADQPDPSTASFSGLAFNPVQKSARPAGVTVVADAAAHAQAMIRRNLQTTYYNHSSPAVREAAGQELAKLGWEPNMT